MKVSLNKIRFAGQHYDTPDLVPDDLEALVQKINAQLGAVETVVPYGEQFEGVLIVKVVACDKHPDADKLSVCKIDDGGKAQDVERDEQGRVQVVCGAPNVRAGMLAAWLPPGTTVPSTRGKEPFILEARELRGQKSNGMLASPAELALGDSHEGLLEVDVDAAPGTAFAAAYKAEGEAVIDIENKMFTHRPDCFGIMGVTREIAGIQHKPFKSPAWYAPQPKFPAAEADPLPLSVSNELPDLVPRFVAVPISGVDVKPSPVWLQIVLDEAGIRPINNIVDYSNFWMLETGQPLHAYDYDKVKALSGGEAALVIRNPKPGEKIKLLNGKTIEPRAEAVMIATDRQLIGIGGVMGGSETEVDTGTKNIILECANFDMYSIRRTSMAHGLFTDAVTRFTKGQSPLQNPAVAAKLTDHIREHAGGKVAGPVIDDNRLDQAVRDRGSLHPPVKVAADFINARLGLALTADEMKQLLENVEFRVEATGAELTVTAPFWRTDIELREDVVEEVGRLYGYDKLPLELPKRNLAPVQKERPLALKAKVRQILSRAGANELLTYSFVHGDLFDKVGQDKTRAFQIANALSPDLQYYRLSLTPSLLEKIHPNSKAGYDEFGLFEIGKAHVYADQAVAEGVPKEANAIAFVYTAKRPGPGGAYYWARYQLLNLLTRFHSQQAVRFAPLQAADLHQNPWLEQMAAPFEPNRSAVLRDEKDMIWGVVGEFKASVRQALKLPAQTAGFEIDPPILSRAAADSGYVPLSRFPKVTQDITLQVPAELPYQEMFDFIQAETAKTKPKNATAALTPLDIYQKAAGDPHKHLTFRLTIASYDRTLTDAEVNQLLDAVAAAAKDKFGAERI